MLLYAVPVTPLAKVAVARSSGGTSLTVDRGEPFGTTFPANLVVFRGNGVLTMLTATARVGKVLTISATLPEGYADAALNVGDGVGLEPTAANPGGVVFAMLNTLGVGSLAFPTLANTAAVESSIFLSSTNTDGNGYPMLCRCDPAGNVITGF